VLTTRRPIHSNPPRHAPLLSSFRQEETPTTNHTNTVNITISNGGESTPVTVPFASQVGVIREAAHQDARENIGAPSSFTLAVNGAGVDDNHILREGDTVTFRPKSAEKGQEG
jgi:hypothetical protein